MQRKELKTMQPLSSGQLYKLANGLLCLFWGYVLCLLFFIDFLRIELLARYHVPTHLVGVVTAYWGILLMYSAGIEHRDLKKSMRHVAFGLLMLVYLTPFLYWWRQVRYSDYLFLHVMLFIWAGAWTLFFTNKLTRLIADLIGERNLAAESSISNLPVILLILAPCLLAAHLVFRRYLNPHSNFYYEFHQLLRRFPPGLAVLLVFPFTMTFSSLWKGQHFCFQRVRQKPDE